MTNEYKVWGYYKVVLGDDVYLQTAKTEEKIREFYADDLKNSIVLSEPKLMMFMAPKVGLNPCPVCNGEAEFFEYNLEHYVGCKKCSIQGKGWVDRFGAEKSWNESVPAAEKQELLAHKKATISYIQELISAGVDIHSVASEPLSGYYVKACIEFSCGITLNFNALRPIFAEDLSNIIYQNLESQ